MIVSQRLGRTVVPDDSEVANIMESLVADNEALKKETAELQNLLAESRDDLRNIREELDEAKAAVTSVHEGSCTPQTELSVLTPFQIRNAGRC